jgi:predicted MFS family arabinose efflux permease
MDLRRTPPNPQKRLIFNESKNLNEQVAILSITRVVLHTLYRMVYPFLSVFSRGLGVDLAQLSLVLTSRSLMGFFGPFLATIADRYGRKVSMLLGLGLVTIASTIIWIFPTFPVFFGGLMLAMLGNLMFIPAMQAFIGDRVAYEKRGRILGITELSWALAFIAGIPFIGWLMARANPDKAWLVPFPIIAVGGLLCLLLIAWRVPNNRSLVPAKGSGISTIRMVLRVTPVLAGLGFAISVSAANEVVNLVFGVWLEDRFALKLAALGAASAIIGISELGGEGLSALLSDRLGKEFAITMGLITSAVATFILYFFSGSVAGALTGLFFFYLGFEFTLVSSLPLMSEVYPAARATVMALTIASFSLGRALGAFLAPRLYNLGFLFNLIAAILLIVAGYFLLRKIHTAGADDLDARNGEIPNPVG